MIEKSFIKIKNIWNICNKNKYNMGFLKIKKIIIYGNCTINKNNKLEEKIRFKNACNIYNCQIGFGIYYGANCQLSNMKIGRFCFVANNLKIAVGEHNTEAFVSTHIAFFSFQNQKLFNYTQKQLFEEITYADEEHKFHSIIGNGVWIGSNATLLSEVIIGDGGIIGANALVLKNMPNYSIVVGVPAKVLKYRFTKEQIDFLMQFKWWNKSEDWIKTNANLFNNISDFIIHINKKESDNV